MKHHLRGQHILLRPLTPADLPRRAGWTADPQLQALMGVLPDEEPDAPRSHEDELAANREWLAGRFRDGVTPYAVEVDGSYIGDIDYDVFPAEGRAELTVFLGDRAYWGRGHGREAVTLVIDELFRDPRIRAIDVDVAPGNERALAFWRRLGFADLRVEPNGVRWLRRER